MKHEVKIIMIMMIMLAGTLKSYSQRRRTYINICKYLSLFNICNILFRGLLFSL